ncbi:hypothetical protein GS934_08175 [Rhodococcus hoagii]|nr:hypothetical protein [Prescottella equi]NKZ87498.1 hypothetical protein [Prescottella equi]
MVGGGAPAGREVFPERIRMVGISDRESAVLEALASTPSVAEIAAQLYVSQNTVRRSFAACTASWASIPGPTP